MGQLLEAWEGMVTGTDLTCSYKKLVLPILVLFLIGWVTGSESLRAAEASGVSSVKGGL